jgi:peptidoglycan/LPS O-acetylase OafA/YrhL
MNTAINTRRYDIDWLRIIAVLLLFPYHVARIFNLDEEFYVKSATLSKGLSYFVEYLGPWHMPLLFFLAGASTWFALTHRSGGGYAGERVKRLLVPFIFGLVVLIPPQSYLGMAWHGGEPGAFFTWLPTFFHLAENDLDGYFAGGMTFGHLWFIIHLFIYSLMLLPIVLFLKKGFGRKIVALLARAAGKPAVILALGLLTLPCLFIPQLGGGNPILLGGMFLLGYMLVMDGRFEQAVDKHRLAALILGPGACLGVAYLDVNNVAITGVAGDLYEIYVNVLVPWFFIIAALGYGRRVLNRGGAALKYAAPASYPVYLLHQTVIIAVGFGILKAGLGVPLSFVVIMLGSFAVCLSCYEIVRRVNVLRVLFGMKWVKGAAGSATSTGRETATTRRVTTGGVAAQTTLEAPTAGSRA